MKLMLFDLWMLCPHSHVFIKKKEGDLPWEYTGDNEGTYLAVTDIKAKSYPNYHSVIEALVKDTRRAES